MDRRSFFRLIAGAASLPVLARLPAPARRVVERVGAWATVRVDMGAVTSISIVNGGSGYTHPSVLIFDPTKKAEDIFRAVESNLNGAPGAQR
jgi:hypothetical protein